MSRHRTKARAAPRPARKPGRSGADENSSRQGEAANQALQRIGGSIGSPLDASMRSAAESRLGMNLGDVRVHRGAAADQWSHGLGARAFTKGNDIVLGRHADRNSLAHELIHVAQQGRQRGAEDAAESEAERLAPELLAGTGPVRPKTGIGSGIHREALPETKQPVDVGPPSFSGDFVDVAGMTNEQLNIESLRVDDWLRAWGTSSDPDAPEYWKLARRLRFARQARVSAGHVWMATVQIGTPGRLIGLTQGADRQNIVLVDLKKAFGAPEAPGMLVMTDEQFQAYLASHNVTVTDLDGYLAMLGLGQGPLEAGALPFGATGGKGGESVFDVPAGQMASSAMAASRGYVGPLDYYLTDPFSASYTNRWMGNMAETGYKGSFRSGFGLLTDPLNDRTWFEFNRTTKAGGHPAHPPTQQNYPIFDFQRLQGAPGSTILGVQRISVKTSQGTPTQRFSYYRSGLVEMLDERGPAFQHFLRNQPGQSGMAKGTGPTPNAPYAAARSQILGDAYLAVNADDVIPMREALSDGVTNWGFAEYARAYNGELRENPVVVDTPTGQVTLRSTAEVDNAAGLTAAQRDAVKRTVGERIARRIVSSGITTQQVAALISSRQAVAPGLTNVDVANWVTPELMTNARYGGGLKGTGMAAGRSGLQGGAGGTLIAIVTTGGVMLVDEAQHPNWEAEMAVAAGMGLGGGAASSAAEQTLIAAGSRYALSGTAPAWMTPRMLKYGGGGLAAFATAPLTEWGSMAFLENRDHSGEEIAVRSFRSAGMGVASYGAGVAATAATTGAIAVIFGAAGSGAAAGSVVPGWGTAIGFVVGLAAGTASYYLLDQVVPGGKESWDKEAGGVVKAKSIGPAVQTLLGPIDRQRAAEQAMKEGGTPFASGIDDESIPAGFGLRQSEQQLESR